MQYLDYQNQALATSGVATDTITGTSATELLQGTAANDVLLSQGGADTLIGGAGDDTYVVFSTTAVVVENPGEGIDTIKTTANYVLPDNVENLWIYGFTGASGTTGTGNSAANIIVGDTNNQFIDGAGGNDVLVGGGGTDTFIFEKGSGHDVITDFTPGAGGDVISLQDYTFQNYQRGTQRLKTDRCRCAAHTRDLAALPAITS